MKNNNKILIITANKDLETNYNKPLTLSANISERTDKIKDKKHNISDYSCNDITNYLDKKGIKKSRKRIGNAENPIRVFEGIQLVD